MSQKFSAAKSLAVMAGLLILLLAAFQVPAQAATFEISINVAPNILSLNGGVRTIVVHAKIAYDEVDASTVALLGVAPSYCGVDDRGYFYAKFDAAKFKNIGLVPGELNDFKLTGDTVSGDSFWGIDQVMVISQGK